jgi:WD40 repeat protein
VTVVSPIRRLQHRRTLVVAAAIEGEKIALIELRSHRVSALLAGHTAPVQVLAFVQEGRRLISRGNDARVLVWEVSAHPEGGSP